MDRPQEGFNTSLAPFGATVGSLSKTAAITADAVGISVRKVERARVVLADPVEAAAVRNGTKTIHQAAEAAKAKRATKSKPQHRSKANALTADDALAEGHRILILLNALSSCDPDERRRAAYKSAAVMVRRALK